MDNKRALDGVVVGDRLSVWSGWVHGKAPHEVITVTKVLKAYVECSDGTRWTLEGRPRPRSTGYHSPRVSIFTHKDGEAIQRERLIAKIRRWAEELHKPSSDVTLDVLRAVAAAAGLTKKKEDV